MTTSATGRIVFLDWLRAGAALLVVWDHLVGQWLGRQGRGWFPLDTVDRFVAGPFVIVQNFGWLGVALFFLISGFIISHVAVSETAVQFTVKRLLRIYPPLIFAILAVVAFDQLRRTFGISEYTSGTLPPTHSVGDVLSSMTLGNYVMVPQPIVLGVAWTLVIELIFYSLVLATKRLLNTRLPILATAIGLSVVIIGVLTARSFGASYFLFCASLSYVPLLLLGQLLWLHWSGRINGVTCAIASFVAWGVFVRGLEVLQPGFLQFPDSYGPSFLLAYALFLVMLFANDRLKRPAWVRYLADRSYSLYLLHGTVGLLILDALYPHVSYTFALAIALGAVIGASHLSHRFVEKPSQDLARRIVPSKRVAEPQAAGPTSPADAVAPEAS